MVKLLYRFHLSLLKLNLSSEVKFINEIVSMLVQDVNRLFTFIGVNFDVFVVILDGSQCWKVLLIHKIFTAQGSFAETMENSPQRKDC